MYTHLIRPDLITVIMTHEAKKLLSSYSRNFVHPYISSSLLGRGALLNTLLSDTPKLLRMRGHDSHPKKKPLRIFVKSKTF
jgi:hypothetical protein